MAGVTACCAELSAIAWARTLGVGLGLIPDSREAGDTLLQRRVAQVSHTGLDGVIEPLQS
jgi:hypothetical protein